MTTLRRLSAGAGALLLAAALVEGAGWKATVTEEARLEVGPDADPRGFAASADARHVAWRAKRDAGWVVVRDGKPATETWDEVGELAFTADGEHLLHWAKRGERWHLVEDGTARPVDGRPHTVDGRTILPAPAGRRWAAFVRGEAGYFAVVDGVV